MTEDTQRRRGGELDGAGRANLDVAAWCAAGVPDSIT